MSPTNSAAEVSVVPHVEWLTYEMLPTEAKRILQNAHANFPAQEIAYLLRTGHTYGQIQQMIEQNCRAACRQTYGAEHPGA